MVQQKTQRRKVRRLRQLRRMREMTQTELAAKVGISKSVIAAYEIGRAKPSLDNAIAIANVFGVHVEDLLELVEVPA